MTFSINKIALDEIEALSELAKECFYESYFSNNESKFFHAYVLAHLNVDRLSEEWHNNNSFFYFAFHNEEAIGFLKLNVFDAQTESHPQEWMEISRFYLLKKYQGKGYGKLMLDFVKDEAQQHHKQILWLGVWPKNVSAIQFYEKMGFEKYGTHPFNFGGNIEEDDLMKLHL